ncbi:peptidase [Bacillus carboniphilus]|uniref:Peptidase n=1 Tax=Bacillus carboniphilus TaxID=86663 RepID=A0ABY9K093_9BACI|nr:peptidase [Bacillus carboniphilus]WLR43321.1 peptidase [Bacillus carboniphilus]
MNEIKNKITRLIDQQRKGYIELLQKVIREKSVMGYEDSAQAIILEKCRELNLTIDLWEPEINKLKMYPDFFSTRTSFLNSYNLVAVKKGTGGGRSIILNGHIDVVPEGELDQWSEDPYTGVIKDGKVYGRGSTDMKGGNIALLAAIEAVTEMNIPLKGDIIFQSVIDEECGGAGTLAAVERGYQADGAIIPEPTDMKCFIKQQGSMWYRLEVDGKSAHGGTRYQGISAIEKMMFVLEEIKKLEIYRNNQITDPLYKNTPIPVPINVGMIKGGNWPSSVPDAIQIEGRCGIAPHETKEQVQGQFQQWMDQLGEKDSWFKEHPAKLEWFGASWLPNQLSDSHPLFTTLERAHTETLNKELVVEASPWGTDGGMLAHVGNVPTIVFGPGKTELAHFPNEYIEIDKVFEVAKVIAHFLIDWCEMDEIKY